MNSFITVAKNYDFQRIALNNSFFCGFSTINNGSVLSVNHFSAEITINNCSFIDNEAQEYGGALYIYYSGNITIKSCHFIGNIARYGGSIYYDDSLENKPLFLDLNSNNFKECQAKSSGGALMFFKKLPNNFSSNNDNSFTDNKADAYGEDYASEAFRLLFLGTRSVEKRFLIDSFKDSPFYTLKTTSGNVISTTLKFVIVDHFYQKINRDFSE